MHSPETVNSKKFRSGSRRRGVTAAQTAVLLALIAVAVVASVRSLGTSASTKLGTTATGIGNPASLVSGGS